MIEVEIENVMKRCHFWKEKISADKCNSLKRIGGLFYKNSAERKKP